MSIVVAGATGQLGSLIVDALVRGGVEPGEIVAAGRNPDRLAEHAERGVRTARIDMDEPDSLRTAFDGADKCLLVSLPGSPRRVAQHAAAIDAAAESGVGLIVYTSWMHADISTMLVAPDHRATEGVLRERGVPHVVLRCCPYFSTRTGFIPMWRELGRVLGAAGEGRMSAATRADLAEAAAVVLTSGGHEGKVYELGGDDPFTLAEFAGELSRQVGETLPYVDLSVDDYRSSLVDAGIDERVATLLADSDRAVAAGEAVIDTGDLRRLVGRPLTTLADAIADSLR